MHDDIAALRLNLMDFDKAPGKVLKPYWPVAPDLVEYAWVPQTMGDQIWVAFRFVNGTARQLWELLLPPELAACLDRALIALVLPYGWHSRDVNGFIQRGGA